MADPHRHPWTPRQDFLLLQVIISTNAHVECSRIRRNKWYLTSLSIYVMPAIHTIFNSQAANTNLEPRSAASLKKRFGVLLQKYLRPKSAPMDCVITDEMKPLLQQILEDRHKEWNLPPLRLVLPLAATESEKVIHTAHNPCRRTSTWADHFQGNVPAQRKKHVLGGLLPHEAGTPNTNAQSQVPLAWSEPEGTEDKAVQHKKRTMENHCLAESAVLTPCNNQEMSSGAGPLAYGAPDTEVHMSLNSFHLRGSFLGSDHARSKHDVSLPRFSRDSEITDVAVEREAARTLSALPNQALSRKKSTDMFEDKVLEQMRWDSHDLSVLKGRTRGPPSEKDESAAPVKGKNDGTKRPRTEFFAEAFTMSEAASKKDWSIVQNMGHPLQRIAKETEKDLVRTYKQVEELIFQLNADHQLKMLEVKQKYEREEQDLDQELESLQRHLRARQLENMLAIRRRKQMYEIEELEHYKKLGRMCANNE